MTPSDPAQPSPTQSATSLPTPSRVLAGVRRAARERVDVVRAAADARWGPARDVDRPIYLIAPAGHPNHGDEQLLAGWLRYLRHRLPGAQVVVDCHTPGQAAVLHHAEHPDVLFTDTLWRLAGEHAADPDVDFCRRAMSDLGQRPALASGIDLLRSASIVHLIGGGYINDQWSHHLGVVAAAGEAGRISGARVIATGQGLVPCGDVAGLADALRDVDLVTVRDTASRDLLAGTEVNVRLVGDDGWLALAGSDILTPADHPVYSVNPDTCRDVVVCAQSDLGDPATLADAIARILVDWQIPGERITVVESIPGGDRVVWDMVCARADNDNDDDEVGIALRALDLPRARFVSFQELWAEGLPARPGQTWLSTRFHPHLFAAARGASGAAVRIGSEYYDVKHGSLIDAGSPWALIDGAAAGTESATSAATGTGTGIGTGGGAGIAADSASSTCSVGCPTAGGFSPPVVTDRIAEAQSLADEIYPA